MSELACACGCGNMLDTPYRVGDGKPKRWLPGHWRKKSLEERFWPKVLITIGCWIWLGAKQGKTVRQAKDAPPYGIIQLRDRYGPSIAAHRASWLIHYGPIPDGMDVLHYCDNLFLGDDFINTQDKINKGRLRVCQGEQVYCAKLTASDVIAIRNTWGTDKGYRRNPPLAQILADQYSVKRATIYDIVSRRSWNSV